MKIWFVIFLAAYSYSAMAKIKLDHSFSSPDPSTILVNFGVHTGDDADSNYLEIGWGVSTLGMVNQVALGHQNSIKINKWLSIRSNAFIGAMGISDRDADVEFKKKYFFGFSNSVGPIGVGVRMAFGPKYEWTEDEEKVQPYSVYPYIYHQYDF